MSDEIEKLMKLFGMANPGVNVNVGPGLAGMMGFSSTDEMKNHVEEMKAFMGKDVEELAAQQGEAKLTVIDVRGKKMVIPKSGARRETAVLVACLYALESFPVDQIFWAIGAKAHFVAKDGSVELALLVEKPSPRPSEVSGPPEKLGGRNILIGEAEPQKACLVGILNLDGMFCKVGVFVGVAHDGTVSVKLADGKISEVPKELVVWVSDEKQLLEIMTEIAAPKQ